MWVNFYLNILLLIIYFCGKKGGKTKISNYLAGVSDKTLTDDIKPTQGARILEIDGNLKINNNDFHVDVQLWDCSGDEKLVYSPYVLFSWNIHNVYDIFIDFQVVGQQFGKTQME